METTQPNPTYNIIIIHTSLDFLDELFSEMLKSFWTSRLKSRILQIMPVQIIKYALIFQILCQSEWNYGSKQADLLFSASLCFSRIYPSNKFIFLIWWKLLTKNWFLCHLASQIYSNLNPRESVIIRGNRWTERVVEITTSSCIWVPHRKAYCQYCLTEYLPI